MRAGEIFVQDLMIAEPVTLLARHLFGSRSWGLESAGGVIHELAHVLLVEVHQVLKDHVHEPVGADVARRAEHGLDAPRVLDHVEFHGSDVETDDVVDFEGIAVCWISLCAEEKSTGQTE